MNPFSGNCFQKFHAHRRGSFWTGHPQAERRVRSLCSWFLLAGIVSCLPGASQSGDRGRTNVMLITLDTTRADCIGAYNSLKTTTPSIDALGADGALFLNGYTPVPLTLPAHASLMTGTYPQTHGIRVNGRYRLEEKHRTLAEILGEKGYQTHAVIASYVLLAQYGIGQGFAVFDDSLKSRGKGKPKAAEISASEVFEKFLDWFSQNHERRFFSWIHFYDPHMPYSPPSEFIRKGSEDTPRTRYEGEIEYVDRFVGRIVAELKARGKLDETLIVLAGDHGEAFGEHREYGHAIFAYEENIRVPLIFRLPRLIPHRRIDTPASLVDVLPTILDLLGFECPKGIQGVSLRSQLQGNAKKQNRFLYFESMWGWEEQNWAPLQGISDGRYKYIQLPEKELYDLHRDPLERANLYRRYPRLSRRYEVKLAKVLNGTGEGKGAAHFKPNSQDLNRLNSLGYLASSHRRTKGVIDPKRGIILDNRLDRLEDRITRSEGLTEVKREIRDMMRKNPDLLSPRLYELLFRAHFTLSEYEDALRGCSEGLRHFPDSLQLRSSMMSVLSVLGHDDELMVQCRAVLERDPAFVQAHLLLSEAYDRSDQGWMSLFHLGKALEQEPGNEGLYRKYAELLQRHFRHLTPEQQASCRAVLENREK